MTESEGDTRDNLDFIRYVGAEEDGTKRRFIRHRGNANPPFTHSPPFPRWLLKTLRHKEITPQEQEELLRAMAPDVARWADDNAPSLWAYLPAVVASK